MNIHFRELAGSLKIQGRVLYALLMREIITRYGRHNIGFAWLFAEPMLFSIGVVILWNVAHNEGTSHHISAIAYSLTGYSTILVWRNTIGRCVMAVEPNASLLYHRNVRVIDFFLARIILELLGTTLSMLILFLFFMAIGLIPFPYDVMSMIIGWVLLCWYAGAMGLLIGALVEFSEVVERLWHPIAYFQLPVSGALVMAAWLPVSARNIVLMFPVANCVELFRYGYYGNEVRTYYDTSYVVLCNLVLTCLGLFVVSAASRRVEPE
ncbi:ABC transporter permease [Burkholderia lata]|uniref:ABC transporter permease n=1 Tax=Burkholderia lata (strain ATCC 17760 / DSM 23089 / LMG 22485 / NCIMB 9086 / R18194 / 383) TaxID=482957 RepID=UPI00145385E3|nr:ABC transporter permease [Burkholderia lata]VWM10533.1 capsular polysaccharide export ABC transporter transmembrane protein [Burkholderia lata]